MSFMSDSDISSATALVIGAAGQDGSFLTEQLLDEGWRVHAIVRNAESLGPWAGSKKARDLLQIHAVELAAPQDLFALIERELPEEIYNLAGQSSVMQSFADPLLSWRTNADFVALLIECVRLKSPGSRFYQASSTEMFGGTAGGTKICNEDSALNPQSPYASAKAAAHLLCHAYREVYGLRIASGILSNHESHRRPAFFLSRKVAGHVLRLMKCQASELSNMEPLMMGNLKVERDWGFAPDYVSGMRTILRQISVRAARTGATQADIGGNYRDYLLATGKTHAVWELVDCAFTIGGFDLEWDLQGDNPAAWRGRFRTSGAPAVIVDPRLLRASEPLVIQVDSGRARRELGWAPRQGLEVFLRDMFTRLPDAKVAAEAQKN